jgi:predicted DNA-binding protein with PD1-like motif
VQTIKEGPWVAGRLDRGEFLFPALEELALQENIRAGFVVLGLGFLDHIEAGYFRPGGYERFRPRGAWELLGLHGSVARYEGRPHIHLHFVASGPKGRSLGGHLFHARVALLVEFLILDLRTRRFTREPLPSGVLRLAFEKGSRSRGDDQEQKRSRSRPARRSPTARRRGAT